ncbi:hypothetical protein [Winogradskyella luteola]|uniref:VWFA domain-containing protein n=1 Tax=Winogradskyella luteola TaxID=2828330 RepID=A0A9X1F8D4_9FLAO|nr:hypothetical protein [Winogradskyella luteola]MBV7268323.1 hypothetical protein [Winogradskyella luteola]
MKTLFTFILVVLTFVCHTQERNVETESVTLDDLITFVVEHYSIKTDSTKTKNITFLIETYADDFNTEDKVILKQAFKLLSNRVTEKDQISIVVYSDLNGIALSQVKATDIKSLLYVIEHLKSSIKTLEDNGIEIAYKFAEENFVEGTENSVVMVRIPDRKPEVAKTEATNTITTTKKKSNAVVLTAIALLPELISVIKD